MSSINCIYLLFYSRLSCCWSCSSACISWNMYSFISSTLACLISDFEQLFPPSSFFFSLLYVFYIFHSFLFFYFFEPLPFYLSHLRFFQLFLVPSRRTCLYFGVFYVIFPGYLLVRFRSWIARSFASSLQALPFSSVGPMLLLLSRTF